MLTMRSAREGPNCDGLSRRNFLRAGALGIGGLTLAHLLESRAAASQAGQSTKQKSVVFLWLGGGPTHVETFDPKMSAPSEFRSVTGAVQTVVPGIELGGTFTKMARVADKMAFVRSFAHSNSGHGGGTHYVMTGYDFPPADNGGGQNKPGIGAIMSRYRGPSHSSGLPSYVSFGGILGDGPSWLGAAYAPFNTSGQARNNMTLSVPESRFRDRRLLHESFDSLERSVDRSGLMQGMDAFDRQAFDLLSGQNARVAFDVSREDPRTADSYGSGLGQQLLLARRLCEAGVGFVTVHYGGWDMHGNIKTEMERTAPPVDRAVAAFVQDLELRGLSEEILLVITGEFGRTPRINGGAGRDHWAPLSTLALAGGGLKMGQVIGESTSKAETPKSRPIGPQDLMATVFHVLGIPEALQYSDPSGRPTSMLNGGRAIQELI